ncbi:MAG TPA: FMN-binding protein [Campylobacterales bacterium]|nr:FMN-binding protein [Campylobacterales bacterium]
MIKTVILSLLLTSTLFSKGLGVKNILKESFSENITVEKKSIILTKEEAKAIQTKAQAKLNSKIVQLFKVKENDKEIGYGVVLKRKVRTKKTAVLYIIDTNQTIKSIEILSFKEPLEYKPNDAWQEVFKGKNSDDMLISGKDIPTISGATMSAQGITDMSRIALAIIEAKTK